MMCPSNVLSKVPAFQYKVRPSYPNCFWLFRTVVDVLEPLLVIIAIWPDNRLSIHSKYVIRESRVVQLITPAWLHAPWSCSASLFSTFLHLSSQSLFPIRVVVERRLWLLRRLQHEQKR